MGNKGQSGRLTRRLDFRTLARKGKKIQVERWLVVNYLGNEKGCLRLGWTIPRQVGSAVVRNRLRRWGREVIRNWAIERALPAFDINIFIRPTDAVFFKSIRYQDFKESLERGLFSLKHS